MALGQVESLDVDLKLRHTQHENSILLPVVLWLGCSKLRHKLAALLHQLLMEVGPSVSDIKMYLKSVVAVCSDQGVEAGLVEAPGLDLLKFLQDEAAALGSSLSERGEVDHPIICDADVAELLCPLHMPQFEQQGQPRDDYTPTEEALASQALVSRLLPNCIFIPGLKHGLDNILADIWGSMRKRERFMTQLRSLETILKSPVFRDKLKYLFFDGSGPLDIYVSERLRHWRSSLKSLRWHEVVNFIRELKEVQHGLQERWHLQKFVSALPKTQHHEIAEGRGPGGANVYKEVDTAIHSKFFWCYADLMLEVSQTADILSRWTESCWYHGQGCSESSCVYKGAKAPELAAGIHLFLLDQHQSTSNLKISGIVPFLREEEAQALIHDWHSAHSRLQLEIQFKFHHWQLLPWRLCGISCNSLPVARVIAKQCLDQWTSLSTEQKRLSHPMTRRFLDPSWGGEQVGACVDCVSPSPKGSISSQA